MQVGAGHAPKLLPELSLGVGAPHVVRRRHRLPPLALPPRRVWQPRLPQRLPPQYRLLLLCTITGGSAAASRPLRRQTLPLRPELPVQQGCCSERHARY